MRRRRRSGPARGCAGEGSNVRIQIEVTRPRWLRLPRTWRTRVLLTLALAGMVAVPLGVASHQFGDVPNSSPHHDDISAIRGAGITTGCATGLYCPEQAVRRDQMASFLRRSAGRATQALGSDLFTSIGAGSGTSAFVTVAQVTITAPGTSGTQFVLVSGQASLFTNQTRANACAGAICNLELHLFDGAVSIAQGLVRISGDQGGAPLTLHAVRSLSAGITRTYQLRARTHNVNTNAATVSRPHMVAATFPFGGTGGSTLSAAEVPESAPGDTPGDNLDEGGG